MRIHNLDQFEKKSYAEDLIILIINLLEEQ